MNLYEKIASARIQFQQMNVKKTGKNTYAGYSYFTLDEILPAVNVIANALRFVTIFDTTADNASLTIVDIDKPEDRVVFNCAYVRTTTKKVDSKSGTEITDSQGASLKGCHPVQNEGATITYLKRYLYLNAFEISESDALDATMNPNEGTAKKDKSPADADKAFREYLNRYPHERILKALGEIGYENVTEIPADKRRGFIKRLNEM